MEERYQAELRYRRRREGETIRDLAQDIHRLMMHAYRGQCESELGQHIARDSFLVALNDPVLQVKVREREPRTLEEAVRLASRIEIAQEAAATSPQSRRRMARRIEDLSLIHI